MSLLLAFACSGKGDDSNPPSTDDSSTPTDTNTLDLSLTSPAFLSSKGDPLASECVNVLPAEYSCGNGNPKVIWADAPSGTKSFALVMDDPDANNFPHWAIYDIPPGTTSLDKGISGESVEPHDLPTGALELANGHLSVGYYGSCPPEPHVYRWRIWALGDTIDGAPEGATARDQFDWLEATATKLALDSARTCHIYGP